jgi:aminoglycoside 6-adenylyltransferase
MIAAHDPREVIDRLTGWADQQPAVRALLLTSSRANPAAPVDIFSDYDAVLAVTDIGPFFTDRSWLQAFGRILVEYWDPIEPDPDSGIEQTGNVVQYADGLKIDFRLWPVALARRIAQAPALPPGLDAGYRVLLDKDGLATGMRPPTYRAYIPPRPTEGDYRTWVEEFFSDVPYVAKCLWRDELLPAKWCLDCDMKHKYLLRMLEWRMERDHGWTAPPGNLGKGLKKRLPPGIWRELEGAYAGAGIEENWEALFRTITLFRRVAVEVAEDLGYAYPHDLDEQVTILARTMKEVEGGAGPNGGAAN